MRRSAFHDRSHFLEADSGDLERVATPEVFAEQLERDPPAVANLSQQVQLPLEVEMAIARIDAVMIVLLSLRRLPGGVTSNGART